MVFSTTNLFKTQPCPELQETGQCMLTNCMFAHDPQSTERISFGLGNPESSTIQTPHTTSNPEPAPKKRRVIYENAEDIIAGGEIPAAANINASCADTAATDATATATVTAANAFTASPKAKVISAKTPLTLMKTVSPPPTAKAQTSTTTGEKISASPAGLNNGAGNAQVTSKKQESLNPRLVAIDPVGHAKRTLYLTHLHRHLVELNQKVRAAVGSKDLAGSEIDCAVVLSGNELIRLALDEEEKTVVEQGAVYANVIKNRIAAYKKMDLEDWMKQRKASLAPKDEMSRKKKVPEEKAVHTGLSVDEECIILKTLIESKQQLLEKYGYIPTPPSEADAKEAALADEASYNYNTCERCAARFQVFPSRNEEGLATGGGKCKNHPKRRVTPHRMKGDTRPVESFYPCCNEVSGTPGCVEHPHHVFKTSNPARLHAAMPFITTPENKSPAKDKAGRVVQAVAFDCEMAYTTVGLELIRLTAVNWPYGETLIDVLVHPLGIVLDLNSQFSGVWPRHFERAIPYHDWVELHFREVDQTSTAGIGNIDLVLPIVENPQAARALLCSFLTPQTPLLGHALENDLNATRLCHPSIVDTVLLFPHRRGLPSRMSLRALAEDHLGRLIQQNSASGHDSAEDAKAAGDLVRVAVRNRWKAYQDSGCCFVHGELVMPPPPPPPPPRSPKHWSRMLNEKCTVEVPLGKRKRDGDGTPAEDDYLTIRDEFGRDVRKGGPKRWT